MEFSRRDLNIGPFRVRATTRNTAGNKAKAHTKILFSLFFAVFCSSPLLILFSTPTLATCPAGLTTRAASLVNNARTLSISSSIYHNCRASGGTLDFLVDPADVTLGSSPGMTSGTATAEYNKVCLGSGVACPDGVQLDGQCVRAPDRVAVTTLDFTLDIHGDYYPSLKDQIHSANFEWAHRLATALGIPISEIEIATLFTPFPNAIKPTLWKFRRQGLPGDSARRSLENKNDTTGGVPTKAEQKPTVVAKKTNLRGRRRRTATEAPTRRFAVAFHVETTRAIVDTCTDLLTAVDWTLLVGVIGHPVTLLSGPELRTWSASAGLTFSAYTAWLQLKTENTENPPLHTEWEVVTLKQHTSAPITEYTNEWTLLICNQALYNMRLTMTLTCEHKYDEQSTAPSNSVLTTAVQFQFSYKTQVEFGIVSSVTNRIKETLAGAIFGTKNVAQDRMLTLVANTGQAKSNGQSYFEAGVIVQALVQAPGWQSYSSEVAAQAVQSYCCNVANGLKLRQSFFSHLQQGLAATDNSQFTAFESYMGNKESNFIDFYVSMAETLYQKRIPNLIGVCASTDTTCTTDAPLEGTSSGAGSGTSSGSGSGTTQLSPGAQLCANQKTFCDCAAANCAWNSATGCVDSGGVPISCVQCPTMASCPNAECAGFTKPCTCATVDKCAWDVSRLSCIVNSVGVSCDNCPSQPKCMPPFVLSVTPASQASVKSTQVDFSFQFSEPVSLTNLGQTTQWATMQCTNAGASKSIVAAHRINRERVHFDQVILLPAVTEPNAETRTCSLSIAKDTLQDSHGLPFPGVTHQITLLDAVPPYLSMHGPIHSENTQLEYSDPRLLLLFAEHVKTAPEAILSLPHFRQATHPDLPHYQIKLPAGAFTVEGSSSVRVDLTSVLSSLLWDTPYAMTVPAALITDTAGNEFGGIPCVKQLCYGAPRVWEFSLKPRANVENADSGDSESQLDMDQVILISGLSGVGLVFFLCLYLIVRYYRRFLERNEYQRNPTIHFSSSKYLSQEQRKSNIYDDAEQAAGKKDGVWKTLPTKVAPEPGDNYTPHQEEQKEQKLNWRAAARAAQAFERSFIITRDRVRRRASSPQRAAEPEQPRSSHRRASAPSIDPSQARTESPASHQNTPNTNARQQRSSSNAAPPSSNSGPKVAGTTPGTSSSKTAGFFPSGNSRARATSGQQAGSQPAAGGQGGTSGAGAPNKDGATSSSKAKAGDTPSAGGAAGPSTQQKRRSSTSDIPPSGTNNPPPSEESRRRRASSAENNDAKPKQPSSGGRASTKPGPPPGGKKSSAEQAPKLPPSPSKKLPPHPDDPKTAKHTKEVEAVLKQHAGKSSEEKKKVLRDLQLKYHPDKCEDPFAKTVFQFVQGAKPWFLQDL
ncbi:unnamed protein product [Amoebophrya sp. A120]|nr:unnamed protein product [Amoebophrya sp. A120]|eukprot:GSA120T00005279001.1